MKKYITYILITTSLMLAACSDHDEVDTSLKMEKVTLHLNLSFDGTAGQEEDHTQVLSICSDGTSVAEAPYLQTRADVPGDPGSAETFGKPKYAYTFICFKSEGVSKCAYQLFELDADKWTKSIAEDTNLPSQGDELWKYSGELQIIVPEERDAQAHIYMLLTPVKIQNNSQILSSFISKDGDGKYYTKETFDAQESDIVDAQCNFEYGTADDNGNQFSYLKDVYFTPSKLNKNNDPNANYYGTIDGFQSDEPTINLRLYHYANKVDLMWNIDPSIQDKTKINGLYVFEEKHNLTFMFHPTDNPQAGNSIWNYWHGTLFKTNIGNQWYGRFTFYTIPFHYYAGNDQFYIKFKFWQGNTQVPDVPKEGFKGTDADGGLFNSGMGYSTGEEDNSFLVKMYVSTTDRIFPTYYRPNLKISRVPDRTVDTNTEYRFNVYYNY